MSTMLLEPSHMNVSLYSFQISFFFRQAISTHVWHIDPFHRRFFKHAVSGSSGSQPWLAVVPRACRSYDTKPSTRIQVTPTIPAAFQAITEKNGIINMEQIAPQRR